ncbi:unnamed protein product [Eruca vesicaria subsp. sativa]|uniref:Uncharacterized protein n=1 Tax=Eruca vesicaria subsp. sativa TaxID=29727 RepID=A0ABC8J020_ERUVS|nr:unnamed protein product [Eruca vesicaria subsp. sativa]
MRESETSTYRDLHFPALLVGGSFAAVAICLSLFLIIQHLRFYTNPSEQKWIVPVLFMVPVYATESIISLSNAKLSLPCDILRNCYEAFALYSFGSYLVACLGGERRVVEFLEDESREPLLEGAENERNNKKRKKQKQSSPFWKFLCEPYVLGPELFVIEKFGLVQYMILKTFCAFLAFLLELLGVYGDGEFKWYYGYAPKCGKITRMKTEVKLDESGGVVEKKETHVEASGTSIKESVQDIVMDGGQHVVKDVVLTINQAMGPVEKGVTKIQEKLMDSDGKEEKEAEVTVETSVEKKDQ